jgi:uncharacterized protein (TIGR02246 family)
MTRHTGCGNHLNIYLAFLFVQFFSLAQAQTVDPREEQAIRQVLARFYDGWNEHDVEKMVSVYAEDIDHINVFGEWHKGKASIAEDLRLLHEGHKVRRDGSIAPAGQKTYSIEKIRFVKPDVAVIQVRSISAGGNLGTYVMAKNKDGLWRVVSFTNVGYELPKSPG